MYSLSYSKKVRCRKLPLILQITRMVFPSVIPEIQGIQVVFLKHII